MTEFNTQIIPKENKYRLQFETDNKDYFERVQTAAEMCMDHKPLTSFEKIKSMTIDELTELIENIVPNPKIYWIKGNKLVYTSIKEWLESEDLINDT